MPTTGNSTLSFFNDSDFVRELGKLYLAGRNCVLINKTLDPDTCEIIWYIIKKNFPQALHR